MNTYSITTKGQVTVPKHVRNKLGIKPGGRASFRIKKNGEVVVEKPRTIEDMRAIIGSPGGATLSAKEKLVIEGMKKDGHKAFR